MLKHMYLEMKGIYCEGLKKVRDLKSIGMEACGRSGKRIQYKLHKRDGDRFDAEDSRDSIGRGF